MGLLGIALPVLPSTPFVLLATWCFARSSEKWHARLLDSELFGPMIRNWEENRCLSCRVKVVAIVSMLLAGGVSLAFAMQDYRLRIATALLLTLGGATVLAIRTCRTHTPPGAGPAGQK